MPQPTNSAETPGTGFYTSNNYEILRGGPPTNDFKKAERERWACNRLHELTIYANKQDRSGKQTSSIIISNPASR